MFRTFSRVSHIYNGLKIYRPDIDYAEDKRSYNHMTAVRIYGCSYDLNSHSMSRIILSCSSQTTFRARSSIRTWVDISRHARYSLALLCHSPDRVYQCDKKNLTELVRISSVMEMCV